jgi:hypothetical protein
MMWNLAAIATGLKHNLVAGCWLKVAGWNGAGSSRATCNLQPGANETVGQERGCLTRSGFAGEEASESS